MDSKRIEDFRAAATRALIAYGYDRLQAQEAVRRALGDWMKDVEDTISLEELVKRSLTHV